jgi:hypothetical protein
MRYRWGDSVVKIRYMLRVNGDHEHVEIATKMITMSAMLIPTHVPGGVYRQSTSAF